MLEGAIIGAFIASIISLVKSNKMPSEKDLERYEQKNGRPMTDEDIKEEQKRLRKSGTIGVIVCPILFVLLMVFVINKTLNGGL